MQCRPRMLLERGPYCVVKQKRKEKKRKEKDVNKLLSKYINRLSKLINTLCNFQSFASMQMRRACFWNYTLRKIANERRYNMYPYDGRLCGSQMG
jgi:hypothetical protein